MVNFRNLVIVWILIVQQIDPVHNGSAKALFPNCLLGTPIVPQPNSVNHARIPRPINSTLLRFIYQTGTERYPVLERLYPFARILAFLLGLDGQVEVNLTDCVRAILAWETKVRPPEAAKSLIISIVLFQILMASAVWLQYSYRKSAMSMRISVHRVGS